MSNMVLCAVALLFTAVLANGAERDHSLHSWMSHNNEGGRNLIYDQVEGWDPETVVVATQEQLPRGVVSDGHSRRFRRAPQMPQPPQGMPQMPEIPQPPQGMPQPPQGMPSPPGVPGMS